MNETGAVAGEWGNNYPSIHIYPHLFPRMFPRIALDVNERWRT